MTIVNGVLGHMSWTLWGEELRWLLSVMTQQEWVRGAPGLTEGNTRPTPPL